MIDTSEQPLVSVVMLTYNHRAYIGQALDSVLSQQTNFPYEILVGDDCSTDGTSEIVKYYAEKYPFKIRCFIRHKNLGATFNLSNLLGECRGKYIASCEGDDYWTDISKLAKQVSFLESNTEYIACTHDVIVVDQAGELLADQNLTWIHTKRRYDFSCFDGVKLPGHPVSLMFRNIFAEDVSPYVIKMMSELIADRIIAMMLAIRGDIYRLPLNMAAYRKCVKAGAPNATAKIYTKGSSYLVDYELNEKIEAYASKELQRNISYGKLRWKLIIKATLKAVLMPTSGTRPYLKTLYSHHLNWLLRRRKHK